MASTYSTNLRLELMATGENRGTWGTKANNDFNLIEQAITGATTIPMGDANVTLTANNGATDQARSAILKFTGTNTATRTATIPTVPKVYLVLNNTGQSLIVSNGGSSVTVGNGEQKLVYTDGTTIYSSDTWSTKSASGARFNAYPFISSGGDTEIGINLDFHLTNADATDYAIRLNSNGTTTDLYVTPFGGSARKIWNQGKDGSGSGMDADTLYGLHASDIIAGGGAAIGTMLIWPTNTPPAGYLKANGALISRTTYAALFSVIDTTFGAGNGTTTFQLPDLRGQFIRGWDDGRGLDAGRVFGTDQAQAYLAHSHTLTTDGAHTHTASSNSTGAHTHTLDINSAGAHDHTYSRRDAESNNADTGSIRDSAGGTTTADTSSAGNHTHSGTALSAGNHSHTITVNSGGSHTHTVGSSGGTETRPTNVALLICIKYE